MNTSPQSRPRIHQPELERRKPKDMICFLLARQFVFDKGDISYGQRKDRLINVDGEIFMLNSNLHFF
jgi:hypothetical protein